MASIFTIPSLRTLVTRVGNDYRSELGADASIRRTFAYALSRAQAGVAHGLYGLISKAVTELHPWTATTYGVLFWAAVLDVRRLAAIQAEVTVEFEGSNGSSIPSGSTLVRGDHAEFVTLAEGTISGGTASVLVRAVVAGDAGNCADDTILTLSTPISGVTSDATVTGTEVTGTDEEALSALKSRYLAVLAAPPQGGAEADYEHWVREVEGVPQIDRVWVTPIWAGEGTVLVRFTVTGEASPVPESGVVDAVQEYIDTVRPVCAAVTVAAPAVKSWEFGIDLAVEDGHELADVRAAVYAEIRALFRTIEPGSTIQKSVFTSAIARATGEAWHQVDWMDGGSGPEDFDELAMADGEIPILEDGGIGWV